MNPATTQPVLEANLGKAVAVTYNGDTEHVLVISVDADGFVCQPVDSPERQDVPSEFWLAFSDLVDLALLPQPIKLN